MSPVWSLGLQRSRDLEEWPLQYMPWPESQLSLGIHLVCQQIETVNNIKEKREEICDAICNRFRRINSYS